MVLLIAELRTWLLTLLSGIRYQRPAGVVNLTIFNKAGEKNDRVNEKYALCHEGFDSSIMHRSGKLGNEITIEAALLTCHYCVGQLTSRTIAFAIYHHTKVFLKEIIIVRRSS